MSRTMKHFFANAAVLAAITVAPAAAHATTVTFPNFADTTGLTLVGSTATAVTGDGTVLRLTPAVDGESGAAYSTTPITLGAKDTFSTTFQFRITDPGGIAPADGITFVLAASPTGLGTGGGDLGYGGVPNSVAVEFDTFDNGGADGDSSNHVAIDVGGHIDDGTALGDADLTNLYGVSSCGFGFSKGCLSNGDLWTATIGYNGADLTVKVFDPAEGTTFTAISAVALPVATDLGTSSAFAGFTAGTGAGNENQDIVNWSFSNTLSLAGVPEPATWAMMLMGFGGMGAAMRTRRKALAASA